MFSPGSQKLCSPILLHDLTHEGGLVQSTGHHGNLGRVGHPWNRGLARDSGASQNPLGSLHTHTQLYSAAPVSVKGHLIWWAACRGASISSERRVWVGVFEWQCVSMCVCVCWGRRSWSVPFSLCCCWAGEAPNPAGLLMLPWLNTSTCISTQRITNVIDFQRELTWTKKGVSSEYDTGEHERGGRERRGGDVFWDNDTAVGKRSTWEKIVRRKRERGTGEREIRQL